MDGVTDAFKQAYSQLNVSQKQAVDITQGPVLVLAGPGTGKTQLLATRVAQIIAEEDVLPQNILALTFTESGEAAMRQRLVNIIGQPAYDVTISTYHSFGSELIRRFPEYFATDDPGMQPIDDLTADRLLRTIFEQLPYDNPLKNADVYLNDTRGLISDFKRFLLTPYEVKQIANDNLEFIKQASAVTSQILEPFTVMGKNSPLLFKELLKEINRQESDVAVNNSVMPLQHDFKASLHEALEQAAEVGKTTPITAWKNKWLIKNSNGQFVAGGQRENLKILALSDIYEQYLELLRTNHFYDYDDMILRAIHGLENHRDLKLTLQEQYQYVLLDEFQDTNPAQLKLIQLLSDNPVYEDRPNVMAVGDDDQAIYAFQGASYSNMITFKKMYKEVKVITLIENYRSHPDILKFSAAIAQQIQSRLHYQIPGIDKILKAKGSRLPTKAVAERREFKSDVAQFGWVSTQIAKLIKSGISASEIAVLAPEHRYLEPLVSYLTNAGIPVRYEKRENILEDAQLAQLLKMAELTLLIRKREHQQADELWPEVLSYQFWQLPTDLIWQLSWEAHDQKSEWIHLLLDNPKTEKIAQFFVRLSQLTQNETLETMLDYLTGSLVLPLSNGKTRNFSSPYYDFYFGKKAREEMYGRFWHVLTNLTVLRQRLRDYRGKDEALKLQDLLDFVNAHREANIKILNTSPYHEAAEAVQLMTAYKAKGQEFETVFILAAQDEVWGSLARRRQSFISLPTNLALIRYAGVTNDERLRLFFVALTRAKHQLYLTNYTSTYAGKPTTRLKFLSEVQERDKIISPLLPSKKEVLQSDEEAPSITTLKPYWQQRQIEGAKHTKLKSLLEPRLQRYQLSPSHLNNFLDVVNAGPEAFFMNVLLRFPRALTPSSRFGDAIHETLEWVHNYQKLHQKLPTLNRILSIFEERLGSKSLTPEQFKLLVKRGQQALGVYMSQQRGSFSTKDEHEFNFRQQGVFVGKAHLTGKTDKLVIDKGTRTITVVDFKTGRPEARWANTVRLKKFRQQLYMYKILVEGSTRFRGYKVNKGVVEFVEPNEHGQITGLVLDFDQEELNKMKKLIASVWQHIMRLDFPDASSYSKNVSGMQKFEERLLGKKH